MVDHAESTEQHSLLGLPFDHYGRYALTRQLVGLLRAGSKKQGLRVLDVGGHSSSLKHFLPDDTVVLVDVEPVGSLTAIDFRFDEYVRGSGAALPFRDSSFDIVAAHDTLEHVPSDFRKPFLEELVRVSAEYIILGGPLWSADVTHAEARLEAFVQKTLGWEQPFLKEHIELGLPAPEIIESFLQARRMPFVRVPSGNLDRWLTVQALRHYLAALPETDDLRVEIDRAYNRLYAESDNDGACYRQAYVAAKTDAGALRRISDRFPASPEEQAHLDSLEDMLSSLEAHAGTMRDHLAGLHERIFRAEQETFEARGGREEALAALHDLDAEKQQLQQTIAVLEARLAKSEAELAGVRQVYRSARRNVRRILGPRKK